MPGRRRLGIIAAVALQIATWNLIAAAQPQESTPSAAEPNPQTVARLVEKEMYISTPLANPPGVDALEVYFTLPGKHPLVVLTHGTSDKPEERRRVTPWAQLQQALWFARRGYVAIVVVRSGYGRSGGREDGSHGGCNSRMGGFEDAGEASADDLRAVMKYAQGLPEVEPGNAVSVGVSTGGFAQVALSADPPPELKAAISFAGGRGGDGHEHNCNLSGLIDAFRSFGKSAHKHGDLPMLWIYSQNDHWFPPAMAQEFEAAYTKSGASNQFVLAPPDGDDGHHLYSHPEAWAETVSGFLKARGLLPLGDVVLPSPVVPDIPAPGGLGEHGPDAWKRYLAGAPYKAFAMSGDGFWGQSNGAFDQALADHDAMERCKKAAGANANGCHVVARTPGVK